VDPWSPLCSKYTGEHRKRREGNERGIPMRPSLAQKKCFVTPDLRYSNPCKFKGRFSVLSQIFM